MFTVPVSIEGERRGAAPIVARPELPAAVRTPVGRPRRAVLTGLLGTVAGASLAGCWPLTSSPTAHPTPHPLAPTLAGTLALIDRYQATMAAHPDLGARLQPLLADHQAHLDALRTAMGGTASPSGSPAAASPSTSVAADAPGAVAALRAAEQAGQSEAAGACLAAPPGYAPLVGSIAACRATHAEVLAA